MASAFTFSTKRLQINRANAVMVTMITLATFIVVFCLVAARGLLSQRSYQERVVREKTIAKKQLKDNLTAAGQLKGSYQLFVSAGENILGGNPAGTGERDGDNAKLILDALPSKYDFPALANSVEKILRDKNFKIDSISGSDDEINQQAKESSSRPEPVEIPFEATVNGSYASMLDLLSTFDKSIRPFNVKVIELSGTDNTIKLSINANSYYQPEKSLNIGTKVVK